MTSSASCSQASHTLVFWCKHKMNTSGKFLCTYKLTYDTFVRGPKQGPRICTFLRANTSTTVYLCTLAAPTTAGHSTHRQTAPNPTLHYATALQCISQRFHDSHIHVCANSQTYVMRLCVCLLLCVHFCRVSLF